MIQNYRTFIAFCLHEPIQNVILNWIYIQKWIHTWSILETYNASSLHEYLVWIFQKTLIHNYRTCMAFCLHEPIQNVVLNRINIQKWIHTWSILETYKASSLHEWWQHVHLVWILQKT